MFVLNDFSTCYLLQALKINVVGINTLKPTFEIEETRIYKENHIVFVGTDEQEKELTKKLLATGLAIDVKVVDQVKTDDETKVCAYRITKHASTLSHNMM